MKQTIVISVCFLFPIVIGSVLIYKKRNTWSMLLVGIVTFVLSQIVLRLPLLSMLMKSLSISMYFQTHFILYILFLGITAGLFEEIARAIGFYCMKKHHDSLWDALALGFGHGGIEAVLLVGLPLLHNTVSMENVMIACFERFVVIMIHVALSIIVWWGVHQKRIYITGVAVLFHALLDVSVGFISNPIVAEFMIFLYAIVLWIICYYWIIKKVMNNETTESIYTI